MGVIKNDDIRYYALDTETVCTSCITGDDPVSEDCVVTEEGDSETVFCDRCKKEV